jgi:hypothetical protein
VGGFNPCIMYWSHSFCETLGPSHDRWCGQWIAIICVNHNCFIIHNLVFLLACSVYGGDERRTQGFGGETTW